MYFFFIFSNVMSSLKCFQELNSCNKIHAADTESLECQE